MADALKFETSIDFTGFDSGLSRLDTKWEAARRKLEAKGLLVKLDLTQLDVDFKALALKISEKVLLIKAKLDTSDIKAQIQQLQGRKLSFNANPNQVPYTEQLTQAVPLAQTLQNSMNPDRGSTNNNINNNNIAGGGYAGQSIAGGTAVGDILGGLVTGETINSGPLLRSPQLSQIEERAMRQMLEAPLGRIRHDPTIGTDIGTNIGTESWLVADGGLQNNLGLSPQLSHVEDKKRRRDGEVPWWTRPKPETIETPGTNKDSGGSGSGGSGGSGSGSGSDGSGGPVGSWFGDFGHGGSTSKPSDSEPSDSKPKDSKPKDSKPGFLDMPKFSEILKKYGGYLGTGAAVAAAGHLAGTENQYNRAMAAMGTPGSNPTQFIQADIDQAHGRANVIPILGEAAYQMYDYYTGASKANAEAQATLQINNFSEQRSFQNSMNKSNTAGAIWGTVPTYEAARNQLRFGAESQKTGITSASFSQISNWQAEVDVLKPKVELSKDDYELDTEAKDDYNRMVGLQGQIQKQKDSDKANQGRIDQQTAWQIAAVERSEQGEIAAHPYTLAAAKIAPIDTASAQIQTMLGTQAQWRATQVDATGEHLETDWSVNPNSQWNREAARTAAGIGQTEQSATLAANVGYLTAQAQAREVGAGVAVTLGGGGEARSQVFEAQKNSAEVSFQNTLMTTNPDSLWGRIQRLTGKINRDASVAASDAGEQRNKMDTWYERNALSGQTSMIGDRTIQGMQENLGYEYSARFKGHEKEAPYVDLLNKWFAKGTLENQKIGAQYDLDTARQAGATNLAARQQELMNQYKPLTANVEGIADSAQMEIQRIQAEYPENTPEETKRRQTLIEAANRKAQADLKGFDTAMKYSFHGVNVSGAEAFAHGRAHERGQSMGADYMQAMNTAGAKKKEISDMATKAESEKGIDPKDIGAIKTLIQAIANNIAKVVTAR